MHIQVNSNHSINVTQGLEDSIRATVEGELERFGDFLTRVEVHINDENAGKAGPQDKRCQIEARMKHHEALSVTHKAESLDLAVDGAAAKMTHALEHTIGKLRR
ncbi:HPF/RaiA family ribosome-associated protein [Stutzerimonas azotifigens]|uniref:HPF/RaiA family ribosome-associated protein n=1 Tax=Stutzerimonas azotifigens TaxID=291995 RepID=UPI00042155AB|nr:HPF/RaiA family ribosome-associated protein [Stutzerimonas azotifigens]